MPDEHLAAGSAPPAPIPIVGTDSAAVTSAATPTAPPRGRAPRRLLPRGLRVLEHLPRLVGASALGPEAAELRGRLRSQAHVSITAMPASEIARTRERFGPAPSSLTRSAPPSFSIRIAFSAASSSETW